MLGAQCCQRLFDEVGSQEAACGDHDHRSVAKPENLGGNSAGEVDLITHDQVRPPRPRELQEPIRALASDLPGE